MGLSLVVGPAHAGKVALLLDRFVDALDSDPWLVVPNRVDVDRVERELAGRCGSLLGGTVGTFDTLFAFLDGPGPAVARRGGDRAQRARATYRCLASRVRPVVAIHGVRRLPGSGSDRDRGRAARPRTTSTRGWPTWRGRITESSKRSGRVTAAWRAVGQWSASPRISVPGAVHRCSRTASRT